MHSSISRDYMIYFLKRHAVWLIPILAMVIITPFTPIIDLFIASLTYNQNLDSVTSGLPYGFSSNSFYDSIYLYGVIPSQVICAIAVICLLLSCYKDNLKPWRPIAWALSLNLILGSGLITHTLLKELWGRPRPRQVIEFGGPQQFRPFYSPKFEKAPEPSRSFPSGHSTTGFYFFCFYFIGKRYRKNWLAYAGVSVGLILGGLLSWARIVQGGHFISDVLIACLIMWLTAAFVDWLVFDLPYFGAKSNGDLQDDLEGNLKERLKTRLSQKALPDA